MIRTVILSAIVLCCALAAPVLALNDDDAELHRLVKREVNRHIGSYANPTAAVELHESLFLKIGNAVTPAIVDAVRKLVIPGKKEKHFSFADIRIGSFNIGSLVVQFAAPNKLIVGVKGLELSIPKTHFDVFTKILFIKASCGGEFWVSLDNTHILIEVGLSRNTDGHLILDGVTPNVNFGALNVGHHFHSGFCRVGQDIIQMFVGNIDALIRKVVEKDIAPVLQKGVTAGLTKLFSKITFKLSTAPVATANSIEFSVDLLSFKAPRGDDPSPLKLSSPNTHKTKEKDAIARPPALHTNFTSRDMELMTSSESLNGVLNHFVSIHHLDKNITIPAHIINTTAVKTSMPKIYDLCPGCAFETEIAIHTAPTVAFMNQASSIDFQNVIVGINAVNNVSAIVPLFDVSLNFTGGIANFTVNGVNKSTIDFSLVVQTLTLSLYKSNIGTVDMALVTSILDFVVKDIVVPDFNKKFKGFTFPPLGGVDVEDIEVIFSPHKVAAGMNLDL